MKARIFHTDHFLLLFNMGYSFGYDLKYQNIKAFAQNSARFGDLTMDSSNDGGAEEISSIKNIQNSDHTLAHLRISRGGTTAGGAEGISE
jgi:hypothetical protein